MCKFVQGNKAQSIISKNFERVFWTSLLEDILPVSFSSSKNFGRILSVLEEIQNALASIMEDIDKNKISRVHSTIDMDLIRQMVRTRAFDFSSCISLYRGIIMDLILEMLGDLESKHGPFVGIAAIVAEIKAKWSELESSSSSSSTLTEWPEQAKLIVQGLELAMDCIHNLRVALANSKLQSIAPLLRGELGIQYLRSRFRKELESGAVDPLLPKTQLWLSTPLSLAESAPLADEIRQKISEGSNTSDSFLRLISISMAELACGHHQPMGDNILPETLRLDECRISSIQSKLQACNMKSIVILSLVQCCPPAASQASSLDQVKKAFDAVASSTRLSSLPPGVSSNLVRNAVSDVVAETFSKEAARNIDQVLRINLNKSSTVYQIVVSLLCLVQNN